MLSIWELEEDLLNEEEDSKPIRKRRWLLYCLS
jgi:hypothetical protein